MEAVDPGSVEHTTVLEMIDQVDSAMPTEEAERVEEAQGAQPYRFLEPDTNPAVVVEGDALSTIATTDIPTEVWDSGPMNVDYGDDDEVEVIPRGSGRPEAMWLTVDQLPDMSKETGFFRLTEYEAVSLSKKLSFHLRGFAKERNVRTVELDEELSADIEEIIRIIGRQWSGLSVKTILDVMTSRHIDKGRFELLAEALDQETAMGTGSNWKFTRIRAFQGHAASLRVLDKDPKVNTVKQWALDDRWEPSYVISPDCGFAPYRATAFDLMPKMAYHATYYNLFRKIASVGLLPGGSMTKKGNHSS